MDVTKHFGLNQFQHLDPDFGDQKQYSYLQLAYRIVVTPGNLNSKIWEFFLFLPEYDEIDVKTVIQRAVEGVVQIGDHYRAHDTSEEDLEKLEDSTPMLVSHPKDEDFFYWICPPHHLRS